MTHWEFAYVYLFRTDDGDYEAMASVQNKIAHLGSAGWEPVGVVEFSDLRDGRPTHFRQLMFKRPRSVTTSPDPGNHGESTEN